jgi:hypothetical protein
MTELSTNGSLIIRPLFDGEDEDREIEKKPDVNTIASVIKLIIG